LDRFESLEKVEEEKKVLNIEINDEKPAELKPKIYNCMDEEDVYNKPINEESHKIHLLDSL